MKIQARTKKHPTPVAIEYDVPEKLPDQVRRFGEDVIAAAAQDSIVIGLQAFMRRLIEKGKTAAEVAGEAGKWMPNVRNVVRQTAFEKAASSLDKLSPEERKQLLAKLQAIK